MKLDKWAIPQIKIINAPINLPVERLDEALAARNPILSWKQ